MKKLSILFFFYGIMYGLVSPEITILTSITNIHIYLYSDVFSRHYILPGSIENLFALGLIRKIVELLNILRETGEPYIIYISERRQTIRFFPVYFRHRQGKPAIIWQFNLLPCKHCKVCTVSKNILYNFLFLLKKKKNVIS